MLASCMLCLKRSVPACASARARALVRTDAHVLNDTRRNSCLGMMMAKEHVDFFFIDS
jgi:hypothetical protein